MLLLVGFSYCHLLLPALSPEEWSNLIIDNYNKQNYNAIYSRFSSALKKNITAAQFGAGMANLQTTSGKIADSFWLNKSITSLGVFLTVFEKRLDVSQTLLVVSSTGEINQLYFKMGLESTFDLVQKHPEKTSLLIDSTFGQVVHNPDATLAICSVFKITVLLTLAQEIANGNIDKNRLFALNQVNKYYLPHVDGTHGTWLQGLGNRTSATVKEIAYGVLAYSSNANTQFIIDLLSPQKIDFMIFNTLGVKNHDKTIFLVSSMLAMNNTKGLPRDQWLAQLRQKDSAGVAAEAAVIHNRLKNDAAGVLRQQDAFYLDPQVIDIHVNFLQRSSAYEYVRIAKLINSRAFFPNLVQLEIQAIFNNLTFSSQFGRDNYKLAGTKGGSANYPNMTNAVLAVVNFATRTTNERTQVALIYNGMTSEQFGQRYQDVNNFVLGVQFSDYLVKELSSRVKSMA